MDVLIKYWPIILCLFAPVLISATAFAILRRKQKTKSKDIILGILTAIILAFGVALPCYIIAVGGGLELILPILLLPLLIMLI